jgi:peroxiredoxin
MRSPGSWVAFVAALLAASDARAVEVGEAAPPLPQEGWLNVPKGEEPPTAERLKGKVVLVEFWFAGCGPCVRAIPHLHDLKDRYEKRGLAMVSVSRDSPGAIADFLKTTDFRLPVASDSTSEVIRAYGVDGFPFTAVVGADGKLAYLGSPYHAEEAVEKALGLETSPGSCLKGYFAALEKKDPKEVRAALERLCEKAPAAFDLKAWAGSAGVEVPEKAPPLGNAAAALGDYGKACAAGAAERKTALVGALASLGPTEFDLGQWSRDALAKAFPLTVPELKQMLEEKRFDAAVDAILDRRPSSSVLDVAAKAVPLAVHASKNAAAERALARKGLMCVMYVFPPRPAEDNDGFWSDLSVSGIATSKDEKRVVGVLLGGAMVLDAEAPRWIERRLARHLVMEALGDGKKPALGSIREAVKKEDAAIRKELEAKFPYAKPPKDAPPAEPDDGKDDKDGADGKDE